jgi:hypothetical protein
MKKSIKTAIIIAGTATALLLWATPATADDTGYINDAVNALDNGKPVYVDTDASLTNQAQISNELNGSPVNVVALPEYATTTYSATDIADQIRSTTGETTVVVVVDKTGADTIAVSSGTNENEIATVLNKALSENGGDAGQAITSTIQDVKTLSEGVTQPVPGGTTSGAGGGDLGIMFILIPVVLLLAAAGTTIGVLATKHKNRNVITTLKAEKTTAPSRFSEFVPDTIIPYLKQLSDLIKEHNQLDEKTYKDENGQTDTKKRSLSAELRKIIDNLEELFTRLNKKGSNSQKNMAMVEYEDKLPKLIEALNSDYYIDIVKKRNLWDESEERLEAVAIAVKSVDKQIVSNIQQVNKSKDLEFQVALDSLVQKDTPTIDSIFKKQISEKE